MGEIKLNIALTRDRILLQKVDETKIGGLYVPTNRKESQIQLGQVLAVGPGVELDDGSLKAPGTYVRDDSGEYQRVPFRPGDHVYFLRPGCSTMHFRQHELFVVHEPSIVSLADIQESLIETQ